MFAMICAQKIAAEDVVKAQEMTLNQPTVNAIAARFEGDETMNAKL